MKLVFHGKKYVTKPCAVSIINDPKVSKQNAKVIRDPKHGPTSWISITLKEGKFRQVRKMTAAVGFPTLRLVRVRIGNYKMEKFTSGEVLPLKEIQV